MKRPNIFLAMPHYGPVELGAAQAFFCRTPEETEAFDTTIASYGSSLLAHTFNTLWASALNLRSSKGLTHFAMLHADIVPEPGWLLTLFNELRSHRADVVSCVVPIKSADGVTSTAIDSGDEHTGANEYEVGRRLTMREVMQLPETFDAAACGFPYSTLCINSGCWIADLSKPWVERVRFQISNDIQKGDDGLFRAKVFSEDWDFARQIANEGGKILATRRVPLQHVGQHEYTNQSAWGNYAVDHMAAGKPLPALVG